jgi:hypothetical protein
MALKRGIKQSNFDSVFDPAQSGRPAKLTIRIKVLLIPRDPKAHYHAGPGNHIGMLVRSLKDAETGWVDDASNNLFQCRQWTEAEFNAFKIKFKHMVELAWNNQLILVPPDTGMSDEDYLQFVSGAQVPAHAQCSLDVELMSHMASSHAIMEAVHLLKRENHAFHTYQHLITNEDVEFQPRRDHRWESLTFYQVAAAHEVGHWLGGVAPDTDVKRYLPHIDAEYCSKQPNHERNDSCEYGHTASKKSGMMGDGTLVTDYEAQVFVDRMVMHTNVSKGWTAVNRINFANGGFPVSARQQRLMGGSRASTATGRP